MQKISEKDLSSICGGNRWGDIYNDSLGCAGTGATIGSRFGAWGIAIGAVGGAAVCGALSAAKN